MDRVQRAEIEQLCDDAIKSAATQAEIWLVRTVDTMGETDSGTMALLYLGCQFETLVLTIERLRMTIESRP